MLSLKFCHFNKKYAKEKKKLYRNTELHEFRYGQHGAGEQNGRPHRTDITPTQALSGFRLSVPRTALWRNLLVRSSVDV